MAKVNALQACIVRINGMPRSILEGQPFDTSDEVVREFPWLFNSDIEQATASPGEKRTTRRQS